MTVSVDDAQGRTLKNSCPIYYFGQRPPRPEVAAIARNRGVKIRHFDVMPLLLDDLCTAVNFYGKSNGPPSRSKTHTTASPCDLYR